MKTHLLLVEDEVDTVVAITKVLKRHHYEVSSTGSGVEAIDLIEKGDVDLVLLDLSLVDIHGLEVLEKLRIFNKRLKVVMMSGTVLIAKDRQRLFELGVHRFLCKPASPDDMLEAIKAALVTDEYLKLEDFPEWHFEPAYDLTRRHKLKGLLGLLNMTASTFMDEIETVEFEALSLDEKVERMNHELKAWHSKIKHVCEIVNRDLTL